LQRLQEVGTEPVSPERRSVEYLQEFVVHEIKKWAAAIKSSVTAKITPAGDPVA
jgi:hypothetical protein